MKLKAMIPAVLALGAATAALAHTGATGIVKERMVAMSAMGDAMKATAPMMSGQTPYDATTVRETAELIGTHAGEAMTRLFPEDDDNMASYVKPAIWEDWESFTALANRLEVYSSGLALAAGNGLSGGNMAGSGSMMGGSMMEGQSMMGEAMMGNTAVMSAEHLGEMPADAVFMMVSDTCSTCHTRFRKEAE